jgi:hypothetical protein
VTESTWLVPGVNTKHTDPPFTIGMTIHYVQQALAVLSLVSLVLPVSGSIFALLVLHVVKLFLVASYRSQDALVDVTAYPPILRFAHAVTVHSFCWPQWPDTMAPAALA